MTEFKGGILDVTNYLQKVCLAPNRGDYIRRQIINALTTKCEPKSLSFWMTTKRAAARLLRHMDTSPQDMLHKLRSAVGEATFLCATADLLKSRTAQTDEEWLVTGLGQCKNSRVTINSYYKVGVAILPLFHAL